MQTVFYRSIHQPKLQSTEAVKRGSWLHIVDPDAEELKKLSKKFGFDPDLLDDGIDLYESPRLEHEDGITYIYIRYSWPEAMETSTEPLLIILTPEMLVTVARREPEPISKIIKDGDIVTTQKIKLLLQILTQVNLDYRNHLNHVTKLIFASRNRLQRRIVNDTDIIKFIDLEEDLNEFLAALQPYGILLKALSSGRYFSIHKEDLDMIEDIDLSTNELIELSKSRLKTIQNMREAYSTIAATNLNRTFKRLTSIAIFLSIFTVIGGLFGMNVDLPFQDNPNAFWFILFIIFGIILVFVSFFRRRNWL